MKPARPLMASVCLIAYGALGCGAPGTSAAGIADVPADALGLQSSLSESPVDLRPYFPNMQTVSTYRHADGSFYARYTYFPATADFQRLYQSVFDQKKSGNLYVWAKGYGAPDCVKTYAQLFLGDDKSFTEVGDYLANDDCHPSIAFGYRRGASNEGLVWSASGGIPRPGQSGTAAQTFHLPVFRQNNAGDPYQGTDALAWNHTSVVEVLPTYQPPYGRRDGVWGAGLAKVYQNVVRLVFFHGTKVPGQRELPACTTDPTWPYAQFYYSFPGYHSYASEYYLAEGKWIVQEALLYIEDGSFWGIGDCIGLSLDKQSGWVSYIDEP
jgi:hypothetical protein